MQEEEKGFSWLYTNALSLNVNNLIYLRCGALKFLEYNNNIISFSWVDLSLYVSLVNFIIYISIHYYTTNNRKSVNI